MDTIEWMMPSLMRMFAGSDDIIRFEPETPEDDRACEDATTYVGYLINRKNEGFTLLHDAIKSSLMTRMGVVKVYCDKRWDEREERYEGLSMPEVQALEMDPEIEVVEVVPYGEVPQAAQMEGMPPELLMTYMVKAKREEQVMEFRAEGCPPEEILINKDARSITDLRFICHRRQMSVSDLLSLGYDKQDVEALPSDESPEMLEERRGRHDYDGSSDYDSSDPGDDSQRQVTVTEAYIKCDVDSDGIAEYRRVVKAGTTVFENEVTDDHPFALFSPILMPYKIIGLSLYDLVEDLQRIKTVLMRQMLDNVYLSNNQRTEVVEGQVNLDDLLQPRPGGIVRVKALGSTRDITTPFIAAAGMEIINQIDAIRDTRTGVTEMNSNLNAEALSKSNVGSEGAMALMQQGAQRIELVARVLAETGIKRMWMLMLKNVSQYQNRAQQVKINGRWLQIDPREWKNKYDMTVSVGVGTLGKQQRASALQMIGQAQEKLLMAGIPGMVTPINLYNTATRLTEELGYKDSDQFFTAPDPNPQPPPPPPPDPAIEIERMKQEGAQQLAQLKGQVDIQVEQMRQESQAQQAMQETQLEAERNAQQMQNEMQLEQYKIDKQMELEQFKAQIARETAIETARIAAEAQVISAANRPQEKSFE
ncbi:MAG TPA: hypothetical protein VEY92_08420 [Pseudoxanthomonas sp.]|nr:hypothetical protein [Pseudoxanthomonas sp.]